jgi:hypothetical protein
METGVPIQRSAGGHSLLYLGNAAPTAVQHPEN